MQTKDLKYEDAIARLEKLAEMMESSQIGLDEISDCLAEARTLVAFCREKLIDTEKKCQSLLNSDEKV